MNTTKLRIGRFETIKIDSVKPQAINRAIDKNHVERFTKRLLNNGWLDPIKVDNDNNLLEGHHRYYAAKKLNQKTIPAYKATWLSNLDENEILKVILQYNATNLSWKNEDYLKKYAKLDWNYDYVYKKFITYGTNLSIGTILKLFFHGDTKLFRSGEAKVRNGILPEILSVELSGLVEQYGKERAQAYALREVASICLSSNSENATRYILLRYKDMLSNNHSKLTSIKDFRPHIKNVYSEYLNMIKA